MDREQAENAIVTLQGFLDGGEIQTRTKDGAWINLIEGSMIVGNEFECRIKPKAREFWIVSTDGRGGSRYPHVLSLEEKEKHFRDSIRYIKVREILD